MLAKTRDVSVDGTMGVSKVRILSHLDELPALKTELRYQALLVVSHQRSSQFSELQSTWMARRRYKLFVQARIF